MRVVTLPWVLAFAAVFCAGKSSDSFLSGRWQGTESSEIILEFRTAQDGAGQLVLESAGDEITIDGLHPTYSGDDCYLVGKRKPELLSLHIRKRDATTMEVVYFPQRPEAIVRYRKAGWRGCSRDARLCGLSGCPAPASPSASEADLFHSRDCGWSRSDRGGAALGTAFVSHATIKKRQHDSSWAPQGSS